MCLVASEVPFGLQQLKTNSVAASVSHVTWGNGAMLTTCPKCSHTYNPPPSSSPCCGARYVNHPPPAVESSPTPRHYVNQPAHPPRNKPPNDYANAPLRPPRCAPAGSISVALHLPPAGSTTFSITSSDANTPCLTLTAFTNPDTSHRVLASMAGGGIINGGNVILQDSYNDKTMSQPQPSPSVPLSFVLPTPPTLFTLPWVVPAQSETDLVRIAATIKALRISGWYYEGLSWQESADLLRDTPPGTFLVRDSSDPRFLFSLSVQTDRGPTSVRLHYVCGQFRLDAERRLAPMMPMFDCVVKLVEHYICATRDAGYPPDGDVGKNQVWVDARGHMYSHILLTAPLYKTSRLPTLQHLSRLVINEQIMKRSSQGVSHLPLPLTLKQYLNEYPHAH